MPVCPLCEENAEPEELSAGRYFCESCEMTFLRNVSGHGFHVLGDGRIYARPPPKQESKVPNYLQEMVSYGGNLISRNKMIADLETKATGFFPGDKDRQSKFVARFILKHDAPNTVLHQRAEWARMHRPSTTAERQKDTSANHGSEAWRYPLELDALPRDLDEVMTNSGEGNPPIARPHRGRRELPTVNEYVHAAECSGCMSARQRLNTSEGSR